MIKKRSMTMFFKTSDANRMRMKASADKGFGASKNYKM
jgi:hypothetical protein